LRILYYRLRIGDIRVFYDVTHESEGSVVEVLVIREKNEAMQWMVEKEDVIIRATVFQPAS
jgi:hypothetical protein